MKALKSPLTLTLGFDCGVRVLSALVQGRSCRVPRRLLCGSGSLERISVMVARWGFGGEAPACRGVRRAAGRALPSAGRSRAVARRWAEGEGGHHPSPFGSRLIRVCAVQVRSFVASLAGPGTNRPALDGTVRRGAGFGRCAGAVRRVSGLGLEAGGGFAVLGPLAGEGEPAPETFVLRLSAYGSFPALDA